MNATIAMRLFRQRSGPESLYQRMARRAAITTVAVLFGLTLAATLSGYTVDTRAELNPSVAPAPLAELPPEWQWQQKVVSFDHMYRESQPTRGLDWIRNSGRLPQ